MYYDYSEHYLGAYVLFLMNSLELTQLECINYGSLAKNVDYVTGRYYKYLVL
jgi:hypothetical protein